jgi:hypothetical protein
LDGVMHVADDFTNNRNYCRRTFKELAGEWIFGLAPDFHLTASKA